MSRLHLNRKFARVVASVVLTVVAAGSAFAVVSKASPPSRAAGAADMPSSPEVEEQFGIRLIGAYVTADGGMVQVQFQVLDADKADAVHTEAGSPTIEAFGSVLDQPGLAGHGHSPEMVAGRTSFVLLANVNELVSAGDLVSVHLGELHVDGVTTG